MKRIFCENIEFAPVHTVAATNPVTFKEGFTWVKVQTDKISELTQSAERIKGSVAYRQELVFSKLFNAVAEIMPFHNAYWVMRITDHTGAQHVWGALDNPVTTMLDFTESVATVKLMRMAAKPEF